MPQRKRLNQRKRYSSEDMNFHMPRVTKSLEACWPLRNDGSALFASDGASGLSPVNTPTFNWQGAHFTAASLQYLRRAEADWRSGDNAGTIMAWIRRDALGATHSIFSTTDEASATRYVLWQVTAGNVLYVAMADIVSGGGSATGTATILAGLWTHIALVCDGVTWRSYVNGVFDAWSATSGLGADGRWFGDIANRDNVCIGVLGRNTVSGYFDGSIRDVRYFSRALSAGEIIACMHPTT